MKDIDWKSRFRSKVFVSSLISLLLVLVNQIASMFSLDITFFTTEITKISETVLLILGLLGIIHNPTTNGFGDNLEDKE